MENLAEILRLAQVVLGIGLVIFVHELGHYIAARLCGVRVETFSLGMGPRLVGWKPGPTQYQIALVPIGGYCRMAGEERRRDGLPAAPDDLCSKGVGQRFFIYSGGVLMNVLFGLAVFPVLFHLGVPFVQPRLGEPIPGTPAWHARLEPGSEVLRVNGSRVIDFYDIPSEVALGDPERTVLSLRAPGGEAVHDVTLRPRYEESLGIPIVGIAPALDRDAQGRVALEVEPGSPAARAGLRSGDRLVGVVGGTPGLDELTQLLELTRTGQPVTIRVAGDEGERLVRLEPVDSERETPPLVGIQPPYGHVRDVRDGPQTERVDVRAGDRLVSVQGVAVLRVGDLRRALLEHPGPLTIELRRGGRPLTVHGPALPEAEALSFADDLQVERDVESTSLVVTEGDPGYRAGLRDGDRVLKIDGTDVEDWDDISQLVRRSGREGAAAVFTVERTAPDGERSFLTIEARPEPKPVPSYGISLRQAEYVYRASGIGEAIGVGALRSWKFLEDSWLTLKRILQGTVSAEKSVGGIITIGVFSYSLAEAGWEKFFFFLCILSINLAFINVLPIPVLDGGHLFFLIVEKIKGSPVSERVLGYSQMVGVVLILSLMVYVTYNDLVRWVFEP